MERIPGPVCFREKFSSSNFSVDGFASSTVASSEVTTLAHEVGNDTMEGGSLVTISLLTVQRARKFSAVLGVTSFLNSMMILPTGAPSAVMSKKTLVVILLRFVEESESENTIPM